jgi:hypothetical protein
MSEPTSRLQSSRTCNKMCLQRAGDESPMFMISFRLKEFAPMIRARISAGRRSKQDNLGAVFASESVADGFRESPSCSDCIMYLFSSVGILARQCHTSQRS